MMPQESTQADRTMWLLLLFLPGCFCIRGPWTVSGHEGGLVTIECHYDPGWETHLKWWCRGENWRSCDIVAKTTNSEPGVWKDRVSIQDDSRRCTFTVTMQDLRRGDADHYWCGIERTGTDLGHPVYVTVHPAKPPTPSPSTTSTAVTTDTPASLDSQPPAPRSLSSRQPAALTSTIISVLLCNLHFVLVTFVKLPLLGGLLCAVMWLSRGPGQPRGE